VNTGKGLKVGACVVKYMQLMSHNFLRASGWLLEMARYIMVIQILKKFGKDWIKAFQFNDSAYMVKSQY
jgi:hypothetical protein